MKRILFVIFAIMIANVADAQRQWNGRYQKLEAEYDIVKLWPDGAPNSNGLSGPEEDIYGGRIANISDPEMWVYHPEKPNGQAIIMCPGGGYNYVATRTEGSDMAEWFNSLGVTYIVLKYRMPNGHCDVPLSDARQAIRFVKSNAAKWGVKTIGVMGGSAGGHLASCAATHFTPDTRPDFQILLYPLITYKSLANSGRNNTFFGENASDELIEYYSTDLQVKENCPPAFIIHCADDRTVPVSHSLDYAKALTQKGVPVSLHIYPTGDHGWGFKDVFEYKAQWTSELSRWLLQLLP